jgi:hypothetical protein
VPTVLYIAHAVIPVYAERVYCGVRQRRRRREETDCLPRPCRPVLSEIADQTIWNSTLRSPLTTAPARYRDRVHPTAFGWNFLPMNDGLRGRLTAPRRRPLGGFRLLVSALPASALLWPHNCVLGSPKVALKSEAPMLGGNMTTLPAVPSYFRCPPNSVDLTRLREGRLRADTGSLSSAKLWRVEMQTPWVPLTWDRSETRDSRRRSRRTRAKARRRRRAGADGRSWQSGTMLSRLGRAARAEPLPA